MNRNDAKVIIGNLVKSLRETNEQLDKLNKLFGCSDSDFHNSIYWLQNFAVKSAAQLVGDKTGMLEWFVCECELGKRPMEHSLGSGEMHTVDSINTLLDAMEWLT